MGEFSVSRSRRSSAPVERVRELVADLHHWTRWSPWEGLDPAMQRTYSGPERGLGAQYAWAGNKRAGSGRMEIVEASAERIRVALEFAEPFASTNASVFDLRPVSGGGTDITWTMTGPQSGAQKALFTLMRMNAKVAKDFDKGLAALAAAAEQG